ncbi:MAG: PEP-CTERM sorting domain-containing protein [Terrimicrobiaceae bacterium]
MKITHHIFVAVTAGLLSGLSTVSAHVSVGADRTLNSGNAIDGLTVTNNVRTVSSSFGWADATDANWGDSHRTTAFKFTLSGNQTVTITVARRNAAGQTGANDILLPAFSLFSGTFVAETHDTSVPTASYLTGLYGTGAVGEAFVNTNGNGGYEAGDAFVDSNSSTTWDSGEQFTDTNGSGVWEYGDSFTDTNGNGVFDGAGIGGSGKEGAFSALAPWKIYSDLGAELNMSTLIGHAADGTSANYGNAGGISGDGTADGTVSATFNLTQGAYYLFVGGANYAAQNSDDVLAGGTTFKTYGIGVTVGAVPEPSTYALLALGAGGIALLRRARNRKF